MRLPLLLGATLILAANAQAAEALYLANEGVLVREGETSVLFDPLFDNSYGQYQLMPADMSEKLFSGDPPFDGVNAVFVSHAHGDHFSSRLVLDYLEAQPAVRLYAPAQAVAALRNEAGDRDGGIFERVTGIALDNGGEALDIDVGEISLTVFRVPHSGWPTRRTDIENLVFQVRLNGGTTVAHFGDADANPVHFRSNATVWSRRETDLAMPPYWFFLSSGGRAILNDIVRPASAVGTHVPTSVPDDPAERPQELAGIDLFTEPGEERTLP